MRSLRIKDGDISLGPGRRAEFVDGRDKLIQDLKLWLMEPFGRGFLTPNFGSVLYEEIGAGGAESRLLEIEEEIRRVLELYQAWQVERLRSAKQNGLLQNFSKSEVLNVIESIEARADGTTVFVDIRVSTLGDAGAIVSIPVAIGMTGIEVGV